LYLVDSIFKNKIMKKTYILALALTLGFSATAQKIKVKESSENIGGGSHNALVVTLYEVNPSDAEDAFRSYMKKYDGKRTTKEGAIFVDHATIKDMGNNTIDIYGKADGKKGDPEIRFIVAFDLGGAFCNSSDHKEQYKVAEKIVKDFAVEATKDAIEEKLKEQQKVQSKLEDDQKSLEKDNKNLNDDIADNKDKIKKAEDKIKKAEDDITKNKSDQDKKKAEIEAQKKVVDDVDKKLKSVE
jgi:esterase/lipase